MTIAVVLVFIGGGTLMLLFPENFHFIIYQIPRRFQRLRIFFLRFLRCSCACSVTAIS